MRNDGEAGDDVWSPGRALSFAARQFGGGLPSSCIRSSVRFDRSSIWILQPRRERIRASHASRSDQA